MPQIFLDRVSSSLYATPRQARNICDDGEGKLCFALECVDRKFICEITVVVIISAFLRCVFTLILMVPRMVIWNTRLISTRNFKFFQAKIIIFGSEFSFINMQTRAK